MAWVAIAALVMVGGGVLVLLTAMVGLVVPAVWCLVRATRRGLRAGLVPTTFEFPHVQLPLRRFVRTVFDIRAGHEDAGRGADAGAAA